MAANCSRLLTVFNMPAKRRFSDISQATDGLFVMDKTFYE